MDADLDLPPAVLAALTPRFTLERQIGAGGMATVFLARDERNERRDDCEPFAQRHA